MLMIVAWIVGAIIAFAMIAAVFRYLMVIIGVIVGLVILVVFGSQVGVAYALTLISEKLKITGLLISGMMVVMLVMTVGVFLGVNVYIEPVSWEMLQYSMSTLFMLVAFIAYRKKRRITEGWALKGKEINDVVQLGTVALFSSFFFFITMSLTETVFWEGYGPLSLVYGAATLLALLMAMVRDFSIVETIKNIDSCVKELLKVSPSPELEKIKKESALSEKEFDVLFHCYFSELYDRGEVVDYDLNGSFAIYNKKKIMDVMGELDEKGRVEGGFSVDRISSLLGNAIKVSRSEAEFFSKNYLESFVFYEIEDEDVCVHYSRQDTILTCNSCGVSVVEESAGKYSSEWYCSEDCKRTERECEAIYQKSSEEFISDALTSGLIVMSGASAWVDNHKVFASGGQGHGFAAEKGNHVIDRLTGKEARILGDDNAKNGADRLVDGDFIQTKYCKTAVRSIGAGFDGQGGNYKYISGDGNPMQIEVPKDQYGAAVAEMEKRIKEGKVRRYVGGNEEVITDEGMAKSLVRKGALTYDQAVNVTKFGTLESVAYDVSEGVIVGVSAGGISFAITAFVSYLNTKDQKEALRIAVVQSRNTFVRAVTVHVATQQLHRLPAVQSMLGSIDSSMLSHTSRNYLAKGFGVSKSGLNKAMRGTVVTSVVVIAVTTGPDLVKLIRGRISRAQFVTSFAVASSGVVGGVVGSVVGGVAGAGLGPAGVMGGKVVGGMIGGALSAATAKGIAESISEPDQKVILRRVQKQTEYLAKTFMLTEEEMDNLSVNLDRVIDQEVIEEIFSKDNRRAAINALLKPLVVSVVKQRPRMSFDDSDISHACEEVVA